MQELQPLQIYELSGGMVSNVSDVLLPVNVVTQSINFHYDVLGKATQRNGTSLLGLQVSASNPCQGISQFITSDRTQNRLVAAFNGINYSYNGVSWTNIGGGMTTASVRYKSFLNSLFRVGGGTTTQSWNASGNFGGTNCAGSPNGKYVESYKQRLYIAGDSNYPNRLWFSTIATFGGVITWDTTATSTQYIDFAASQANDVITGLGKISNLLIIFLNNAMYRWNATSTDAEIVVDIGCSSQESIAQCKGSLFFFNPQGIFSTTGGYPQEISRPVYDWIKNMSSSNYNSVSAFTDQDHYYCNIGNVTKDSRTYTNVWLVYTISSQNWAVYSLGGNFQVMTSYVNSSNATTYVGGDDSGNVQTLFSGNTDNGSAINYELVHKSVYYDSLATTKTVKEMAFFCDNGAGTQVMVSPDKNAFSTLGEIQGTVTLLKDLNLIGKSLSFKITGSNKATPVVYRGFEIFTAQSQGYVGE